jgi:hypothetical protein
MCRHGNILIPSTGGESGAAAAHESVVGCSGSSSIIARQATTTSSTQSYASHFRISAFDIGFDVQLSSDVTVELPIEQFSDRP